MMIFLFITGFTLLFVLERIRNTSKKFNLAGEIRNHQFLTIINLLSIFFMSSISSLSVEAQTPVQLQWQVAATLPNTTEIKNQLGVAGPVAGRVGNYLLVGGGANFPDKAPWLGGAKQMYDQIYLFRKTAETSLELVSASQHLPYKLAYPACVSTKEGLVVMGGQVAEGLTNKVLLLSMPANEGQVQCHNLPNLPQALANAAATVVGSCVYLAGGELEGTDVSDTFYRLDLQKTKTGWVKMPNLPKALSHHNLVAVDGSIYLLGGRKRHVNSISELSASVYRFDLQENCWIECASLPYPLSAGTAAAIGSTIVVFGGDKGTVFHRAEMLIAAVNQETDPLKKQILNDIKADVQSTHPGFSNEILCFDPIQNQWKKLNPLPFAVPVTTTAVAWDNEIYLPSGEIKAGVRSPAILVAKPITNQ